MQHLNYCRQIRKEFNSLLANPGLRKDYVEPLNSAVEIIPQSVKFMLPFGGIAFDDKELRALDDSMPLRLPFPAIALEWEASKELNGYGSIICSKRVALCYETDGGVAVVPIVYADAHKVWRPMPGIVIPFVNYLDRSQIASGGPVNIRFDKRRIGQHTEQDYCDEMSALLSFLNALQCSNVKVTKSEASKTHKALRKKGALPFDDYHLLTIEVPGRLHSIGIGGASSHRSPREHLRRGHIRTYERGLKVWVNAAVVNPGVGGKITKDYRLAA